MAHLLVSGIPMGATGIFYNHSLETINASLAIILLLQFTWIGIVIQYIFDRKKPTKKEYHRNSYYFTWICLGI